MNSILIVLLMCLTFAFAFDETAGTAETEETSTCDGYVLCWHSTMTGFRGCGSLPMSLRATTLNSVYANNAYLQIRHYPVPALLREDFLEHEDVSKWLSVAGELYMLYSQY